MSVFCALKHFGLSHYNSVNGDLLIDAKDFFL